MAKSPHKLPDRKISFTTAHISLFFVCICFLLPTHPVFAAGNKTAEAKLLEGKWSRDVVYQSGMVRTIKLFISRSESGAWHLSGDELMEEGVHNVKFIGADLSFGLTQTTQDGQPYARWNVLIKSSADGKNLSVHYTPLAPTPEEKKIQEFGGLKPHVSKFKRQ